MQRRLEHVRMLAACALVAACASNGSRPPLHAQVVEVGPAPGARAPAVAEDVPPFADPLLAGLEPTETWTFRQETWSGLGVAQQHCRELGYPTAIRDRVLREANELLAAHGVTPRLPETVRANQRVIAFGDFRSDLAQVATEPLVKLVICSEGAAPKSERDRFVEALRNRPSARELPFGEPSTAWRREYRDGREEYGFRWSAVTREDVATVLAARGYTESTDRATKTITWSRGGEAMGRMPGSSELWWSAVR